MIRWRTRHLHISISCWIGSCKVSISSVEVEKAVIAFVIHRSKGKMSVNWNPVSPTCIHHSSLFVVIVYNEHTFFPNATCGEILRVYATQTLPLVRKIVYKCVRWADKYTVGLPRRPILCLITPEMVGGKCIWHFSDVSFCDASLRWSCAVKMKDLDCLTVKKLLSSSKTVVCMLAYILRRFLK